MLGKRSKEDYIVLQENVYEIQISEFINKVLLEYRHTHLITYYLWMLCT